MRFGTRFREGGSKRAALFVGATELIAAAKTISAAPIDNSKLQAALDAEVMWLCKSGMVRKIYTEEPDFNARSLRMERLCSWRIRRQHPDHNVTLVTHCHQHIVSLALQMWQHAWDRNPAADATIPLRLVYDDLTPDGQTKKPPPRERP